MTFIWTLLKGNYGARRTEAKIVALGRCGQALTLVVVAVAIVFPAVRCADMLLVPTLGLAGLCWSRNVILAGLMYLIPRIAIRL